MGDWESFAPGKTIAAQTRANRRPIRPSLVRLDFQLIFIGLLVVSRFPDSNPEPLGRMLEIDCARSVKCIVDKAQASYRPRDACVPPWHPVAVICSRYINDDDHSQSAHNQQPSHTVPFGTLNCNSDNVTPRDSECGALWYGLLVIRGFHANYFP